MILFPRIKFAIERFSKKKNHWHHKQTKKKKEGKLFAHVLWKKTKQMLVKRNVSTDLPSIGSVFPFRVPSDMTRVAGYSLLERRSTVYVNRLGSPIHSACPLLMTRRIQESNSDDGERERGGTPVYAQFQL